MSVTTELPVRDSRPPNAVVRVTNVIVRPLLRTRAAKLLKPLALLEFTGRRSGAPFRIVVGWHVIDDVSIVITPAGWRANFVDGHPVTVHRRGTSTTLTGTLESDPAAVADAVNRLLDAGVSARSLALSVSDGHVIDADDIVATGRAMIRFASPRPRSGAGK